LAGKHPRLLDGHTESTGRTSEADRVPHPIAGDVHDRLVTDAEVTGWVNADNRVAETTDELAIRKVHYGLTFGAMVCSELRHFDTS